MKGLKTPIKSSTDGGKAKAETAGKEQPIKPRWQTHAQNGVPIIYAKWENIPGAVIFTKCLEEIARHLATIHGRIADQIITLSSEAIERPEAPIKPEKPIGQVSDQEFRMYELQVSMFMQENTTYAQVMIAHNKASEKVIDKQRACLSDFLGYVSGPLKERIKLDVPDLTTSFDIPAVVTAVMKFHAESNVKSQERIMLHAYQAHAGISQRDGEELFDYNDRYIESMRVVAESEFPSLTDQLEAIKFVESLNPKLFLEWQNQLTNKEHDIQAAGGGESVWPKNVQEAYRIAASRVVRTGGKQAQAKFFIDDQIVSTINAARQVDSEGRGGGTRDPKKTHARKPKEHKDDEVDREDVADEQVATRECKVCDGVLNYLSNGKKHFDYKCPFKDLATDHKREMLKSLSDSKELKALKAIARTYSDSDEEDIEMSPSTIMGWGPHRSI